MHATPRRKFRPRWFPPALAMLVAVALTSVFVRLQGGPPPVPEPPPSLYAERGAVVYQDARPTPAPVPSAQAPPEPAGRGGHADRRCR